MLESQMEHMRSLVDQENLDELKKSVVGIDVFQGTQQYMSIVEYCVCEIRFECYKICMLSMDKNFVASFIKEDQLYLNDILEYDLVDFLEWTFTYFEVQEKLIDYLDFQNLKQFYCVNCWTYILQRLQDNNQLDEVYDDVVRALSQCFVVKGHLPSIKMVMKFYPLELDVAQECFKSFFNKIRCDQWNKSTLDTLIDYGALNLVNQNLQVNYLARRQFVSRALEYNDNELFFYLIDKGLHVDAWNSIDCAYHTLIPSFTWIVQNFASSFVDDITIQLISKATNRGYFGFLEPLIQYVFQNSIDQFAGWCRDRKLDLVLLTNASTWIQNVSLQGWWWRTLWFALDDKVSYLKITSWIKQEKDKIRKQQQYCMQKYGEIPDAVLKFCVVPYL
jgi:hypothetical protein